MTKIKGKAQLNFNDTESKLINKFDFHLNGDIIPDIVPNTAEDALGFMSTIPNLLKSANNGKGKAIRYKLLPVNYIKIMTNAFNNTFV